MKTYEFLLLNGKTLKSSGTDPLSALLAAKRLDKNINFRLKRYAIKSPETPPPGYSLLDIGYGLHAAYRVA